MFNGSSKLTNIDLSNASFDAVTSSSNMFDYVPISATIKLKNTEANRTLMGNFSGYNFTYVS